MRQRLAEIILKNESIEGRVFDGFIQLVIVISLVSFSLETLPNLDSSFRYFLGILEHVCVSIFTLEYLLRLWLTKKSSSYFFSFYGIIDLVAILPYYVSAGVDLRSIRAIRLLRIFRIFKLSFILLRLGCVLNGVFS